MSSNVIEKEVQCIHCRYVVLIPDQYGGHFGKGETIGEALANVPKRISKKDFKNMIVKRYLSMLPFYDGKDEAPDTHADVWVDRYGGTNWIRCQVENLQATVVDGPVSHDRQPPTNDYVTGKFTEDDQS